MRQRLLPIIKAILFQNGRSLIMSMGAFGLLLAFSGQSVEAAFTSAPKQFAPSFVQGRSFPAPTPDLEKIRANDLAFQLKYQAEMARIRAETENFIRQQREKDKQLWDGFYRKLDELESDVDLRLRIDITRAYKEVLARLPTRSEENYWAKKLRIFAAYPEIKKEITTYYGKNPKGKVAGIATADRSAADFIQDKTVPAVVEKIFNAVFGRKPIPDESKYWKFRARSDKATETKLGDTMKYFLSKGWTYETL